MGDGQPARRQPARRHAPDASAHQRAGPRARPRSRGARAWCGTARGSASSRAAHRGSRVGTSRARGAGYLPRAAYPVCKGVLSGSTSSSAARMHCCRRSCGASCRDGACMAAASSGRSCLQTGGRKSTLHFGDAPLAPSLPPPHDEPTTHTNQAHHDRNRKKKKSATFPRRWLTFTLRRPCILILHLRCDRHDTIVDLPCPRICLQMMRAC